MLRTWFRFIRPRSRSQSGQRSKSCLSNNSKTTEANLTKLHRKTEHYDKVFHAQDLGSYAQGQDSLAVFKVTARDQGHYKGNSGAFDTYCNISCFLLYKIWILCKNNSLSLAPPPAPPPPSPSPPPPPPQKIIFFFRIRLFVNKNHLV